MMITPQNLRGIYVGFNTIFNKALGDYKPLYPEIATVTPSTTDTETYAWLGDIPGMREWIGEREIQNLTASEYTIKNKSYEATIGIDRDVIEDDRIRLWSSNISALAQNAAKNPDKLIFRLLAEGFTSKCFDGNPFFSEANKT